MRIAAVTIAWFGPNHDIRKVQEENEWQVESAHYLQ